ncbi:hypothetical protein J6X90_03265 [Candidatus Saccharibacteria bacterium]|nr:hypothetical protein [Candidatus Saccharibacteria bacterium]
MGFFNKIRGRQESEAPVTTEWDNLSIPESRVTDLEQLKNREKNQRDKLIAALCSGNGILPNEPRLGDHDELAVMANINTGKITYNDFAKVINSIKSPLDDERGNFNEANANAVLEKMSSDKHQLKMLCFANGINTNDYGRTTVADLQRANNIYQNPMEFEAMMVPFFDFLAANNPPQKVHEYQVALGKMEQNLFGKQYDYYLRAKELVADIPKATGRPLANNPLELPQA